MIIIVILNTFYFYVAQFPCLAQSASPKKKKELIESRNPSLLPTKCVANAFWAKLTTLCMFTPRIFPKTECAKLTRWYQ